tara:strand:- start:318 stop:452 length:135 start_codon:yes stop_codon:yes gene_type:complete
VYPKGSKPNLERIIAIIITIIITTEGSQSLVFLKKFNIDIFILF